MLRDLTREWRYMYRYICIHSLNGLPTKPLLVIQWWPSTDQTLFSWTLLYFLQKICLTSGVGLILKLVGTGTSIYKKIIRNNRNYC